MNGPCTFIKQESSIIKKMLGSISQKNPKKGIKHSNAFPFAFHSIHGCRIEQLSCEAI